MFNSKEFMLCRPAFLKTLRVPVAVLLGLLLSACGGGGGGGSNVPAPVSTSPVFTTQPASDSVIEANTADFDVVVTGSPTPTLQWQFSTNGGANFTDIVGATANSYSTPVTVFVDSGNQYRVVATNSAGTVTSNAASLTVVQLMALPETGQITCYDVVTNLATPCADTGQDGNHLAGVAWPPPRFEAGAGATADCVTDNLTGLMWPANANLAGATRTWQLALDDANNLTLCGFSDWRLPNRKELFSLINHGQANNTALNSQGFSNVQANIYWSSSSAAGNAGNAWNINFAAGHVASQAKSNHGFVWPVRAGR